MYRPTYTQVTRLFAMLIYAAVIAATAWIAHSRVRYAAAYLPSEIPPVKTEADIEPFFSLSTNRTFGSSEKAVLWLDHRGLNNLDFRVYRVNEPQHFFAQLSNPHQMGEDESEQMAGDLSKRRSVLERVRAVKVWAYAGIRNYFRDQLKHETRFRFNQKFRASGATKRVPLNVADYARVPLLNPNQLVSSWREPLTTLETEYDRRMIPLGERERGVYLVEAVSGDLRAYTVVVITDLAMVEKASPNGELLVYAVDRKNGAPESDARVEIVKARATVASGTTNGEGLFHATIPENKEAPEDEVDDQNLIVFASQRDNFAISDLESFYFFDEKPETDNVEGYIYTDRPIYRPNHKVFFKGILRAKDEKSGYRAIKGKTVNVTIQDSNDARVFEQELRLSKYGTFKGELTLTEEAPLGMYRIIAETEEGESSGNFDVAEYKKPEYKVNVTTPKRFVRAGSKSRFEIDARYFFGPPVAGAEVKYYVYRSRYYPYFGEPDEASQDSDDQEEYLDYGNYYNEIMLDSEGKLDAAGHLAVDFDVPVSNEEDVWDFQYRLEAQVTDSSRRSIDGTANLIATRGSVIARAEPERYVYNKDETARIMVSTSDYEGQPAPAKLSLKFMLRTWEKVAQKINDYDPDYQMRETELSSGEVNTDREGHAIYDFRIPATGSISIKTVVHESGRQFVSPGGFIWSTSASNDWSISRYYNSESLGSIKLVPDKKSYRPGETAHVLAILPEEGANVLLTTEYHSVMYAKTVHVPGKTAILDVPIEKNYAPSVFVSVTFVKNGDMFSSDERLQVPARDKMLNLEIISNKTEYKPRETASYTILARDADGLPVPDAEVSLGVVDEALYSVSPDYSGNIRQQFYGTRYNSVETKLSISYYFRGFAGQKSADLASTKPSYQLADFKSEGEPPQALIRKEFKDTAFWEPSAVTGKDGRATVKFRLPDNLTTWRATARGVTSDTMVGASR